MSNLLRTIKDVELEPNLRGTVEVYGRGGDDSPELWLLLIDGRRVTPYERRLRGPSFTLSGTFKVIYYHSLAGLIPQAPLLYSLFKKPKDSLGNPYTIPVTLGFGSGFTYPD